jgi:hypothetical protein
MKTWGTFIFCFFLGFSLMAQEKMYIHKSDRLTLGAPVADTDSIYFSEDESTCYFRIGDTLAFYPVIEIDSITFGPDSDTVFIDFDGSDVAVINPLAFEGVSVTVEGMDVTVHSDTDVQDINYCLSGSTSNGTFKTYSLKRYNLIFDGVSITNPDGPAINLQSSRKAEVVLVANTLNNLADGLNYSAPPAGEDQDGAFFSEGRLVFSGDGMLNIFGNGSEQHGLCSDDEIEINDGSVFINSASRDGVHARNGIMITSGTLNVISSEDGIDGDMGTVNIMGGNVTTVNSSDNADGITSDTCIFVSGGILDITVSGDQSKGINSSFPITLSGGEITIHTSGDAVLVPQGSGYDPSYCTGIKSSDDIYISGSDITIYASGKAGKGISSDTEILISAGSINITSTGNGATYTNPLGIMDAYVSDCFRTEGDVIITGGSIITSSSGTAGKGFSVDGDLIVGGEILPPTIQVTTTGARIQIGGGGPNAQYAEAKAIRADAAVVINNGIITISSSDDGIKSVASIEINAGTVTVSNSKEGLEAPFITVNGGNVHVNSTDDAINSTFGFDGEEDDGSLLTINGGWVVTNATGGDGLDCNGDVLFTGGTTIVHGPLNSPEVGMDYNGTCDMNGGFLVISGTNSFMTQAPSNSSDQYCLKITFNQSLSSSTLFHIQDANSEDILTFQPLRPYYSIIFSSDDLQTGMTYSIYTGGTSTGVNTDGLYSGGTYSGGTFRKSFNITGTVTNVNF